MYNLDENDDFDRELIATYEEVSKLYPRPGIHRPIILIGAPGVGRNELKRRLVGRDPEKYRSPVPCESEFIFVSRQFQNGIAFISYDLNNCILRYNTSYATG